MSERPVPDPVLACIDASAYAQGVCDLAAWAALRLGAPVEVLHVVQRRDEGARRRDLSGAIGLGVKSGLLEELTRLDEAEAKLAVARGRELLAGAVERLRAAGVSRVEALHRHGGIAETIVEREAGASLVVIGRRGGSGEFAAGHLGSKVERVVRASARPVLVAPREGVAPTSAVLAFDASPAARRAADLVAASPLFAGLPVHLVTAGDGDRAALDEALARFAGREATATLVPGDPERVLAEALAARPGALLVMGAYGHSPLRALLVGSTTTTMVRTARGPVLLVR